MTILLALLACASTPSPTAATRSLDTPHVVLREVLLPGTTDPVDIELAGGSIVALGSDLDASGATEVAGDGHYLAPAFIDSHVHLAYLPRAADMARGGIAAAVDLASPVSFLDTLPDDLEVLASGPMITAEQGYPTQGWGAAGYGLEVSDAAGAEQAVADLVGAGARLVKLPVTSEPVLDDDTLAATVAAAHAVDLPVASHALGDESALRAAQAGADVLAHTPTEPLGAQSCALWSERAVISTLRAFGGSAAARENLAELHARGAVVLYGTDFGNTSTAGVDDQELALLAEAGFSPAEILAMGTTAPASFWGLEHLGSVEVGKDASLMLVSEDPLEDPSVLAAPDRVWIRGREP